MVCLISYSPPCFFAFLKKDFRMNSCDYLRKVCWTPQSVIHTANFRIVVWSNSRVGTIVKFICLVDMHQKNRLLSQNVHRKGLFTTRSLTCTRYDIAVNHCSLSSFPAVYVFFLSSHIIVVAVPCMSLAISSISALAAPYPLNGNVPFVTDFDNRIYL